MPHRGTLILVLGILALVFSLCCPLVGIVLAILAWVLGNGDMKQMEQGIMDSLGRGNTSAGRICGMIAVGVAVVNMIVGGLFYGMKAFRELNLP